jgi:hypothetical protein
MFIVQATALSSTQPRKIISVRYQIVECTVGKFHTLFLKLYHSHLLLSVCLSFCLSICICYLLSLSLYLFCLSRNLSLRPSMTLCVCTYFNSCLLMYFCPCVAVFLFLSFFIYIVSVLLYLSFFPYASICFSSCLSISLSLHVY